MKGIILAGGSGSRLAPMTQITNKHLLPCYDKPVVYYPINTLVKSGITDICIVTGGENSNGFFQLLKNGDEFGIKNLQYFFQEGSGGIAQALSLTERFADAEPVVVILGDNIFENPISEAVKEFESQKYGAKIFLKEVPDPERFGVAELQPMMPGCNKCTPKVLSIEEKPKEPKSNLAVVGLYMFDETVYDKCRTLKPSGRGELEVTDLNRHYLSEGHLTYNVVDGFWIDCGTPDSLLKASILCARQSGRNI